MRTSTLRFSALVAAFAPLLASSAFAAFTGDFYLTDLDSPAGYYTPASNVTTLGQWSVSFATAADGTNFIDTTSTPGSVTLGSTAGASASVTEGETSLFIEVPQSGRVSFTIQSTNSGGGAFGARAEVLLSGVALYALTGPSENHVLEFDAFSGETIEFRSFVISGGTASFASNTTTISNFTVVASVIPEPSAFASFAGLFILGGVATRRRGRAA